jgi:hypothetical protein
MDLSDLLLEFYGRVPPIVSDAVDGLGTDQLTWSPEPAANSIGWLAWHLTRVQDHHISELLEADQLWVGGPWAAQCGLEPDPSNTGYGHSPDEVHAVRPQNASVLVDYLSAVHARTSTFLEGLSTADLDAVVDRRWDPPVTMGVRLVSIGDDSLQHAGQASYVRGLLERASS